MPINFLVILKLKFTYCPVPFSRRFCPSLPKNRQNKCRPRSIDSAFPLSITEIMDQFNSVGDHRKRQRAIQILKFNEKT